MKIRDEAYEKERDLKRRSSADVMIGVVIGRLFKVVFWTLWTCAITIAWVVAGLFAEQWSHNAWMGLILVAAGLFAFKKTRICTPVWGDAVRLQRKMRFRRQVKRGNELIVHMGLVSERGEDEKPYAVRLIDTPDEARLYVDKPIVGVPSSKLIEVCRSYKDRLDAKRVRVDERGKGVLEVVFLRRDPLDEGQVINEPAAFDPETMKVTCAVDAVGREVGVSFHEVSGMVVGGIPGSGKTAGLTSFLLPLALSDDVELTIIDGKGADDWTAYKPLATRFVAGDDGLEDLEAIRDVLADFHGDMLERMQTNRERLGQSNYWNVDLATRRDADAPFKLLIVDECQGLFETAGRTSKEAKAVMSEILRYTSSIVKRGRSAGVCAVFITQKPTSEALPTAIRDNAALRLAFRVATPESERAVLGLTPDDIDTPRATTIPSSRKGGAVMARDTGELADVRFYYMPELRQREFIEEVSTDGAGMDDDGTDCIGMGSDTEDGASDSEEGASQRVTA